VGGWSYDVGASMGHNRFSYDLENTLNVSLGPCLEEACAPGLDGVLGTADDPGIPNKTEIFAGQLRLDELVASADAAKPFSVGLPAPLNVAVGVSFRRENYEIVPGEPASYIQGGHPDRNGDPAPPGSQVFAGFQPSNAVDESRDNVGGYLDLETNVTPQLLVNGAGRFEHYSDFGEKVTGKLALRYQPASAFVLRGAVSTGFRAPSVSQSFYGSTITNFVLDEETGRQTPVEVGIFPVASEPAQALGARALRPETSVNLSVGFAASPLPTLTFTADYYFIRIEDRIILTAFIGGDSVAAILASRGLSVEGAQYFTNALTTRTQGVDLTAAWRIPLGAASTLDLNGGFNFTRNRVLDVDEPPELAGTGAVLFDSVSSGGLISLERERPLWRTTLAAIYSRGAFHGLVRSSVYGKFTSAQIGACTECVQTYGAKALFDVEAGYRIADQVEISVGARNVFDTYPDRPSLDNSFGIFIWPAASPFGYNGRFLYTRVELSAGP
jgi:iron complex outermembrane receptor protein